MKNTILFILLTAAIPVSVLVAQQPLLSQPENYEMVFADEFSSGSLDWNVWESADAISTSASGQKVGRWKENAVVSDGNLKLTVKKGNRADSEWTAAYVWVKKLYGPNTYYEARFKCTDATGVNNAFWTACNSTRNNTDRNYKNRYEIDAVEVKRLNGQQALTGHLAWHDWKTYGYTDGVDIAQGVANTYNTIDYQTWGLWVGEDHFIIYCDGVEQWRGTTHPTYKNQWNTGVGKLPRWYTDEEQRAYGRYGQDDWSYMGGMNGDDMNICFSTMPWSSSNSTLKDAAHNTSMDVDYLRIYKLKRDLNMTPGQQQESVESGQSVALSEPMSLASDRNYYFSFVASRPHNGVISCDLLSQSGLVAAIRIAADNEMEIDVAGAVASTREAYPACEKAQSYFDNDRQFLIVGRVTATASGQDIISATSFELGKTIPEREPFLYRNIDARGNTSATNEWAINKKLASEAVINEIGLSAEDEASVLSDFTVADNYRAVTAKYTEKPTAFMEGESKSATERRVYLHLAGEFPFSVTYTDGTTPVTISDIVESPYSFTVRPTRNSVYRLEHATDRTGQPALVGGCARFFVDDETCFKVMPGFDTYLTVGSSGDVSDQKDILVGDKREAEKQGYFVFTLPEQAGITRQAHAVMYLTAKSPADAAKVSLLASDEVIDALTTWETAPIEWETLDTKPLGTTSGFYIDFDVTGFCNRLLAKDKRSFTLKLAQTAGDPATVLKFKPGHNTTTSVPSYLVIEKSDGEGLNVQEENNSVKIIYYDQKRVIDVLPEVEVTRVELYHTDGRLLKVSETAPVTVPDIGAATLLVRVVTPKGCYVSKFVL